MCLINVEQKLLTLKQPVLQTSDVSGCLNINRSHASKILDRLVQEKRFIRLMRGKWATSPQVDPLILPEYLTVPYPAYISLQTALYYHGLISQIPNVLYTVTLARSRRYQTPLAVISVHHMEPSFFFGYELMNKSIKIATPEKALLDIFYLSPAKSGLFKTLPELLLPKEFNFKKRIK